MQQQEYIVIRTGDRPLKFRGELIAEAGGRWHAGKDQTRWHEIRVYRTAKGKYVLEIEYCTLWEGEDGHHRASIHDIADDVANELQFADPLEHFFGYPPHPQFAEKQVRLEESLRLRWDVLLSEILSKIPGAEEICE